MYKMQLNIHDQLRVIEFQFVMSHFASAVEIVKNEFATFFFLTAAPKPN